MDFWICPRGWHHWHLFRRQNSGVRDQVQQRDQPNSEKTFECLEQRWWNKNRYKTRYCPRSQLYTYPPIKKLYNLCDFFLVSWIPLHQSGWWCCRTLCHCQCNQAPLFPSHSLLKNWFDERVFTCLPSKLQFLWVDNIMEKCFNLHLHFSPPQEDKIFEIQRNWQMQGEISRLKV